MDNLSNTKASGKRNPLAFLNRLIRRPDARTQSNTSAAGGRPGIRVVDGRYEFDDGPNGWRELRPGDLVTVVEDDHGVTVIASVIHSDDTKTFVQPLYDFREDGHYDHRNRWTVENREIRLLVQPDPLPRPSPTNLVDAEPEEVDGQSVFGNLIAFATDLKRLKARAKAYVLAAGPGGLDECDILEPFDVVLGAVLGTLGAEYLDEGRLSSDRAAVATGLLAGNETLAASVQPKGGA